jgi:hypothetical protein
MLPPLSSYRNERDSLGGFNDPSFYSNARPGRTTGGGGQLPSFSAGPCFLITRTDMGEYRVPLQFIPVEEIWNTST